MHSWKRSTIYLMHPLNQKHAETNVVSLTVKIGRSFIDKK